ncbi:pyridoxal 5'-phosphate synthase glutaminase subunit PdxT [Microbacterium aurantiacum]|uniref:Pyridoxal 5'-phosphate synthase subunit PdxT n=1 Tax=Microbacterium aurantiacum TaxID=162393 RepID=A0AAJ2HJT1_9MICO|nr:pyridoxal 5'-phosphate synthase glutaminase subunit PdxT [Microbacterium aurantiacum]MDN4463336.1 pyridoxal 5'-phosphate synthase glutaminase subunit PdxT [Microbacterium aurantiacum]MDS0246089.1 pyridoxal 5'-phosphate synthase glutaminase subunit PdxT [Microbacterium aurantiacum]
MVTHRPRVGILALQGDVREHARVFAELDADVRLVRRPEDLSLIDGLVLPGGESSVIDKLARAFGMREPIREAIAGGLPVYGTCAGMILLADRLENPIAGQQTFGGLDATVRRNAFGGQVESFEVALEVPVLGAPPVHAAFIRAPVVVDCGARVEPLAALADGRVVAVRQGAILATAFHPEVSGETRFHALFLRTLRAR